MPDYNIHLGLSLFTIPLFKGRKTINQLWLSSWFHRAILYIPNKSGEAVDAVGEYSVNGVTSA